MKKSLSTVNFMYFLHNFTPEQLQAVIKTTTTPIHLFNKFNEYSDREGDGTKGLISLFMNLSPSNQVAMVKWVEENYTAFDYFRRYEGYTQERDNVLQDIREGKPFILTREFCEEFVNRLPEPEEIPEEYLGRDAQDYHSWGQALFGDIFYNAEQEVQDLKIFQWLEIYNALDNGEPETFYEAVSDILEIEDMLGRLGE